MGRWAEEAGVEEGQVVSNALAVDVLEAAGSKPLRRPTSALALCPDSNPPGNDAVMTPRPLARLIVGYFRPSGRVLDPARGEGAFYDAMRDLSPPPTRVDWCEIEDGVDFLNPRHSLGSYDWIVTNPPWSKMRNFLLHSMRISENVVFVASMTHFVTKARLCDIRQSGFGLREALLVTQPPAPWPSSGFQLAAVWLQRGYTGGLEFTDAQSVGPQEEMAL
jgi:hypothetical protein